MAARSILLVVAYHYYETANFGKLNTETLKVLFADDYTSMIKTIVSTRSTILQILPGFSILAIFANLTSAAPLFVFSKDLELSLHELVCKDPEGMARRTEEEFTDMINDIRMKELHEGGFCIDIPDEIMRSASTDISAQAVKRNIDSYNERARQIMKRCLEQDPLLLKEWVVKLKTILFFVTKSRLIIFMYELANFCLIISLLFGMRSESSYYWFIAMSIIVNVPMILIKSLPVYIVIGKILNITDVDIKYFHQFALNVLSCRFQCGESHWLDDEGDDAWADEDDDEGWDEDDEGWDEDDDIFGFDSDEEEVGVDHGGDYASGWSL